MGQAKQRGTFKERKAEAIKKQDEKAAWLAQARSMNAPNVVRPAGKSHTQQAIMTSALALAAGVALKKE